MDSKLLLQKMLTFILALYGDPSLPRKMVQTVIDFMNNFFMDFYLESLKTDIMSELKKFDRHGNSLKKIDECFQAHKTIFDKVLTESNRFQLLLSKGYTNPEEICIGTKFVENIVDNDVSLVPEQMYASYVPLKKTLKLFLEIPGVLSQILQCMNCLFKDSYIITNIIQGDMWKRKYSINDPNDIILPLYLFYDELEVGNALGSHAGKNKFGALYASIACLPRNISSKLDSIFFTMLVRAEDKKNSSNNQVFNKVIQELNILGSKGIKVFVDGIAQTVKFQLVLILGDNLGLNSILGFVESFKACVSCRICKISLLKSQLSAVENEAFLRNRHNYEEDLLLNDAKESGIKEACIFNEVNNFHVTENITVDMMHDVLEGVCIYVLRSSIYSFIFVKKFFTLQTLNNRIQNFDFSYIENPNKPPIITINRNKNNKLNLKMSASEMLCFVRYFGLIMGDLIPQYDEIYDLYLYLRQIVDIVTSPKIIRGDASTLNKLVEELNTRYIKLYGLLKPKFHHLVHYGRILLQNGPCINFWAMRFESRHRQLKANALSTSCKKNLLKTIAIKQVLQMCNSIHKIQSHSSITFGSRVKHITHSGEEYYNEVEIDGTFYKIGCFIVTNMEELEKKFGKIMKIQKKNDDVWFEIEIFQEIEFDCHYHAYVIENVASSVRLLKYADLPKEFPCLFVKKLGKSFIATRHQF